MIQTSKLLLPGPKARAPRAPLLLGPVPAGWPSPAEDYVDRRLNLHDLVVKNPAATYFVWAAGDSMLEAGIHDGDLLVVDRSVPVASGRVVIAALGGELTVKYFRQRKGRAFLEPGNPAYRPIEITGSDDAAIWGVVTYVLHRP